MISNAYWPPFEERTLEETEQYVVRLQADGIVARQLKHGTSVPQFLEYPLKSESDWPAIRERLDPHRAERYAAAPGGGRPGSAAGATSCASASAARTDSCATCSVRRTSAMPCTTAPQFLHRLLEHWLFFNCALADRLCPLVDFDYVFLWEDMAFKNGPLMSPAHFRLFILPRYRELLGYLRRRHGLDLVMVDSDGDNWQLLPLFLEGGREPVHAAGDRRRHGAPGAAPALPRAWSLLGGIDKRALLPGREAIRAELERKVPALLEQRGLFPRPGPPRAGRYRFRGLLPVPGNAARHRRPGMSARELRGSPTTSR